MLQWSGANVTPTLPAVLEMFRCAVYSYTVSKCIGACMARKFTQTFDRNRLYTSHCALHYKVKIPLQSKHYAIVCTFCSTTRDAKHSLGHNTDEWCLLTLIHWPIIRISHILFRIQPPNCIIHNGNRSRHDRRHDLCRMFSHQQGTCGLGNNGTSCSDVCADVTRANVGMLIGPRAD